MEHYRHVRTIDRWIKLFDEKHEIIRLKKLNGIDVFDILVLFEKKNSTTFLSFKNFGSMVKMVNIFILNDGVLSKKIDVNKKMRDKPIIHEFMQKDDFIVGVLFESFWDNTRRACFHFWVTDGGLIFIA